MEELSRHHLNADEARRTLELWANSSFRFMEVQKVRRGVGFEVMGIFDIEMKAEQAMWFPPVEHLPQERLGKAISLIFVELKSYRSNFNRQLRITGISIHLPI